MLFYLITCVRVTTGKNSLEIFSSIMTLPALKRKKFEILLQKK